MTLEDDPAAGTAEISGTFAEVAFTASSFCSPLGGQGGLGMAADVSGTPAALSFAFQNSFTSTTPATVTSTAGFTFAGALNGGVVTGTLTRTESTAGQGSSGNVISGRGSVAMPVTLR